RCNRDGGRGVAPDRLEDRAAATEIQSGKVGADTVGMALGSDEMDRRIAAARRKPANRADQHRALPGHGAELLGIVLARQRPEPRPDAAAHHEADNPLLHRATSPAARQRVWLYAPTSGPRRKSSSIASNICRVRSAETGLSTTTTSSGLLEEA